jgi:hypothetical protein
MRSRTKTSTFHRGLMKIFMLAGIITFAGSNAWADTNDSSSRQKSSQTCQSIITRKKQAPVKACPGILATNDVAKHIGELATVEFLVDHTHECHKGLVYLNESKDYKTCFAAVIARDCRKAFPNDTSKEYAGKRVRVKGKIEVYGGTPKIILEDRSNISVLQN